MACCFFLSVLGFEHLRWFWHSIVRSPGREVGPYPEARAGLPGGRGARGCIIGLLVLGCALQPQAPQQVSG